MRIGVDVMGGDNAPQAILEGALAALDRIGPNDQLVLVGREDVIRPAVESRQDDRIVIQHAPDEIGMGESPVEAVRNKQNSSITMLARMGSPKAEDRLDVILSAGNTGAMATAAQMYMRRLPHVTRPGIAVVIPTFAGPIVVIDVGANIEPKPQHLAEYGVMGHVYANKILDIKEPRVALMNVGGEEQKGTAEMKQARDLLRDAAGVNFSGYIEGRGVFTGEADVVVTDGLVGNVMIKLAEGLSSGIFKIIGREVQRIDPKLAEQFAPVVKKIYADHDYHEYGGAPLLGVNGVCVISHGSSESRTITNAIVRAKQFHESGVNKTISEHLGKMERVPA
ncbi:MAG: phosphate acyltransferase PlsX [Phycisphaerales bacterium]|nr:MAG: phosphate acyltransferase PlsX [Phycisphaerales bacterium]